MNDLFALKGTRSANFKTARHLVEECTPEEAAAITLYDGIFYTRIEHCDPEIMGWKIARHVLRLRAPWFVEFTPNGDAIVFRKRDMGTVATFIVLGKDGPVAAYKHAMGRAA